MDCQLYQRLDRQFIESHAAQRKQSEEYSTHEWGNLHADKVSKLKKNDDPKEIEIHELLGKAMSIEEILQDLMITVQRYSGAKDIEIGFL